MSPKEEKRTQRFLRELAPRLLGVLGIWLKNKEASIAVHDRGARPRVRENSRAAVARTMEKISGLPLISGKKVWEILPRGRVGKWATIRFLLRRRRQQRMHGRELVFYLGDNATDERASEKMTGHLYRRGEAVANFRANFLHLPQKSGSF